MEEQLKGKLFHVLKFQSLKTRLKGNDKDGKREYGHLPGGMYILCIF